MYEKQNVDNYKEIKEEPMIFRSLWPKITDVESAKKARKQGLFVFGFSIVVTLFCVLLYMLDSPVAGIDLWALIDVAIVVLIMWGIYKMNRFAAITGLIFYILEQTITFQEGGTAYIITAVFVVMLINTIRGVFAYHKFKIPVTVYAEIVEEDVAAPSQTGDSDLTPV